MAAAKIILCVDDEESVLLMQKLMLESAGFRVLTASSGLQAVEIFKSEKVNAVVMDYWMPGMNGVTTAQVMKRLKPQVPILFVSAFTELPGETLGLAQGWIKKGQDSPEQFISRLHCLVNENGSQQCTRAS